MAAHQTLLFFSRGKGRGHAVPDAAIAADLAAMDPAVEITFASYGTGLATLRDLGCAVIDLDLPEDNPLWNTVGSVVDLLRRRTPDLIVSHEEFAAVPIAKAFGIRVVFLTDWLLDEDHLLMKALAFADEILFMDEPGYFDEPEYLVDKITYVGTVFRHLERRDSDGRQKRADLSISEDATVISVVPGGAALHSEASAPIFDVVISAFHALPFQDKRLVWVASESDYQDLATRAREVRDVVVIPPHRDVVSTMLASDLVITKGNRMTVLECEALGVPSISISFGINPMDEQRVVRIPTNTALRAGGIDESILTAHMMASVKAAGPGLERPPVDSSVGRRAVTQRLLEHLKQACVAWRSRTSSQS